jgi:FMN phosphatase YigB (HAD superfamily)
MATIIFFDLGDTLVTASYDGEPPRLRLQPLDFAEALLARLSAEGSRLGIISNTGNEQGGAVDAALSEAGLLCFFESSLRIYSADFPGLRPKPFPDLFVEARRRSGEGSHIRFVGENAAERAVAGEVGFEASDVSQL